MKYIEQCIIQASKISMFYFSGKPSGLDDKDNPNWIPSQNMGHISQAFTKRKHDMNRKQRVDERQKLIHKHDSANPVMEKEPNDEDPTDGCDGLASQTDLTMEALDIKFEQLQSLPLKKLKI
ncbi:uncharacterized protein [Leptinotarsa decemlineata]|uniref:uncharacterized protein n=1 Tax=Leptinotarsa decemlineata TaxID=7539 RepID=UPI003D3072E3